LIWIKLAIFGRSRIDEAIAATRATPSATTPAAWRFGREPPRLVVRHQSRRRSPAGLLLEIDIRQRAPGGILHDETGVRFLDGPGRRETAFMHRSSGRQRKGARSPKISAEKRWIPSPGETRPSIAAKPAAHATTAALSRTPCSLSLITLAISDQKARANASPKSIVNTFTSLRSAATMQTSTSSVESAMRKEGMFNACPRWRPCRGRGKRCSGMLNAPAAGR
jgi:hypothetical protein